MKKDYEKPELEIVIFMSEDVLQDSGILDDNELPPIPVL